jgi:hypothetical protein
MGSKFFYRLVRPAGVLAALAGATGVVALGLLAVPAPRAHAQDSSAAPQSTAAGDSAQNTADMGLVRAAINADRVDILNSYLGLTDTEATAFWPLYKEYRTELNKVSDDQMNQVGNYLENRDKLSDDQAKKITENLLNARKKKVDIQKGYLGKFAKVLPGKKVARLYQLENKVDAVLAYAAADRIPLVPVSAGATQ